MNYNIILLTLVVFLSNCNRPEEKPIIYSDNNLTPPEILLYEHRILLSKIDSLALMPESTGEIAIKLKELMHHHFKEEEENVFPALALLQLLAEDKLPHNSAKIIQMSDQIKKQHKHMIAEHQLITAFLKELITTAKAENREEMENFKKAVERHASAEESIYFPAAVLVGDYLRVKTKK